MIFNYEAETHVLGCILVDSSLIGECDLKPEHFATENHQRLFRAMRELEAEETPIDFVTLSTKEPRQIEHIGALVGSVPSTYMFEHYQRLVLEAWKLRTAQQIGQTLMSNIEEEANPRVIADTIAELSRIDESGVESEFDLKETLFEIWDDMEKDAGQLTGINTGFSDFNAFTNGLQRGDLIIVGARPSVGKTAWALNIGYNAAHMAKAAVGIFSLEMSKKSLLRRMISSVGMIDATKMRNPKQFFEQSDWDKAAMAFSAIGDLPIEIYDKPNVTVQEIRAKARALKRKNVGKDCLLIVDYLQLIQGNGSSNRVQEMGEISRTLKLIAREYDMPIIALSQLSRSVESRADKRPMLSDLRESGNIEQDADVIAFLYRDDYYDAETEKKNVVEIIIGKQRNGATGTIELVFLKQFNKFINLERLHRQ